MFGPRSWGACPKVADVMPPDMPKRKFKKCYFASPFAVSPETCQSGALRFHPEARIRLNVTLLNVTLCTMKKVKNEGFHGETNTGQNCAMPINKELWIVWFKTPDSMDPTSISNEGFYVRFEHAKLWFLMPMCDKNLVMY